MQTKFVYAVTKNRHQKQQSSEDTVHLRQNQKDKTLKKQNAKMHGTYVYVCLCRT